MSGSLKLTRRIMPPANGVSQAESGANSRVWASGLESKGRGREMASNSMCRIYPRRLKRNRLSPRLLHLRGVVIECDTIDLSWLGEYPTGSYCPAVAA